MQTYTLHVFFLNEYHYHDSIYMTVFADSEEQARKMVTLYLEGLEYKNINIIDVWNLNTKKSFLISESAPRVFTDLFFEDLEKEMSEKDETMG